MAPQSYLAKFDKVFQVELEEIWRRRDPTGLGPRPAADAVPSVAHALTGLALSGGGVRSASFALGVLQALSARGMIDRIDYLSTVSGGGYIGTAMTVAMSENGGLFPFIRTGTASDETPETKHLRDNSRYLIQNGLPSAISAAAVYLRGFVMNLLVVAPILISTSMILIWMHEFLCWLKCGAIPPGSFRTLACFTFYPAALSMLLGLALLTVWVGYAILVSVHRTGELRKRQLLAWWAAVLLSAVVLLLWWNFMSG